MNNLVFIVGRPQFDLPNLRKLYNQVANLDLTTHSGTSISVFNKLICGDEYKNSSKTLKQHIYTIAIICDSWVLLRLHTLFDRASFYSIDTKNNDYSLTLICASLHEFIIGIIENCTKDQERNVQSILNNFITALERDGLGQLFKDYNKIKTLDGFFLEKK